MIYIDNHELPSIQIELKKHGLKVERKHLEVGDYAIGEFRIERKSVQDFMSSIYSRRLLDQLYNLKQAEKPILVVVGDIPPKIRWMRIGKKTIPVALSHEEQCKRYATIRANMILAYISYNVQVFHALDEDDFVEFLCGLYKHSTQKGETLRPLKRKSKSPKNIRIDVLGCFPNIGKQKADRFSKDYTIKELFSKSPKQLKKIMGDKTSSKLIEIISRKNK